MRVLTFLVVLELLPRLAGKITFSELIYELQGKYSLESTDPRESEFRLVSGRELRTGSGLLDVFGQ